MKTLIKYLLAILFVASTVNADLTKTYCSVTKSEGQAGASWLTKAIIWNGTSHDISLSFKSSTTTWHSQTITIPPNTNMATSDIVGYLGLTNGTYCFDVTLSGLSVNEEPAISFILETYTINLDGSNYGLTLPSLNTVPLVDTATKHLVIDLTNANSRSKIYILVKEYYPYTISWYGPNGELLSLGMDIFGTSSEYRSFIVPQNAGAVAIKAYDFGPGPGIFSYGKIYVYATSADNVTNCPILYQ